MTAAVDPPGSPEPGAVTALVGAAILAAPAAIPLGLSATGWTVSAAVYGLGGLLVAARAPRPFGWPNLVTAVRLALTALLVGLLADGSAVAHPFAAAAVAASAIALDGVDGFLARRFGPDTAFGARFDMETDAFAILVLCGLVVAGGTLGPWMLLGGLLRYLFVAAAVVEPALAAPLPPSLRRKAVCVIQLAALVALMVPDLPALAAALLGGGSLALLVWSFAVDVRSLLAGRVSV